MIDTRLKRKLIEYNYLRKCIAEANDGEVSSEAEAFIEKYQDCVNQWGKISPQTIAFREHSAEMNAFIENNTNLEEIFDTWAGWIKDYNQQAYELGLDSKTFGYVSDDYLADFKHSLLNPVSGQTNVANFVYALYGTDLTANGCGSAKHTTNFKNYNNSRPRHKKKTEEEIMQEIEDRARTNMNVFDRNEIERNERTQASRLYKKIKLANDADVEQFLAKYDQYKNLHGKISPFVYCYIDTKDELNRLAYDGTKNDVKDVIVNAFNSIVDEAKEKNVPSEYFNYPDANKWPAELIRTIDKQRNAANAIIYVGNALLKGDNLGIAASIEQPEKTASQLNQHKKVSRLVKKGNE